MKVYSVILNVQYEGMDLLGVFADRESAVKFIRNHEGFGKWHGNSWGFVESELGQSIDSFEMIEWVE